jgi:hypothetical protein
MNTRKDSAFALHTPPLEIEPLSSSTTAVSSQPQAEPSVESLKASARSSRQPATVSKCGDAVGQPRKGTGPVRPASIVEADEEEEQEVQHISTRIGYREPLTASSSQPSRGTKRGATRIPVDRTPSSTRTLEIPSTLARSTSTASMQSTTTDIDDRAHKRRPVKTPSPMRGEARAYHHEISDNEPLTPSRKVNVVVIEEVQLIETKMKSTRPQRNGSEMVRPVTTTTSSPGTPLSKLKFGITRKSPPAEEVSVIPAAPELARTKGSSREGTLARAGGQGELEKERQREKKEKEKEKMMSPPRFGARLLSRLGATGTLNRVVSADDQDDPASSQSQNLKSYDLFITTYDPLYDQTTFTIIAHIYDS